MKTVMDAVNEFKGEWPNPKFVAYKGNEPCVILSKTTVKLDGDSYEEGVMYIGGTKCSSDYFVVICIEKEFNDLVSQLETNFGESESIGKYNMRTFHEESLLKSLPEQPVFTQAMADNGKAYSQQKSVLMEESLMCIIDHLSECGISISNDYHAPSIDDLPEPQQKAKWVAMNALDRLVIDTRTDKEKAIDVYIAKQVSLLTMHEADMIREAFNAGVKWVGE